MKIALETLKKLIQERINILESNKEYLSLTKEVKASIEFGIRELQDIVELIE